MAVQQFCGRARRTREAHGWIALENIGIEFRKQVDLRIWSAPGERYRHESDRVAIQHARSVVAHSCGDREWRVLKISNDPANAVPRRLRIPAGTRNRDWRTPDPDASLQIQASASKLLDSEGLFGSKGKTPSRTNVTSPTADDLKNRTSLRRRSQPLIHEFIFTTACRSLLEGALF